MRNNNNNNVVAHARSVLSSGSSQVELSVHSALTQRVSARRASCLARSDAGSEAGAMVDVDVAPRGQARLSLQPCESRKTRCATAERPGATSGSPRSGERPDWPPCASAGASGPPPPRTAPASAMASKVQKIMTQPIVRRHPCACAWSLFARAGGAVSHRTQCRPSQRLPAAGSAADPQRRLSLPDTPSATACASHTTHCEPPERTCGLLESCSAAETRDPVPRAVRRT